jgi:hypothetical protein
MCQAARQCEVQTSAMDITAETCLRQALAVARHQKAWELRAAFSLSRLWQHQGKRAEAYDLLASVYNRFTEGFDTADLPAAVVLLEEVGYRDVRQAL